jgi:hypothetical protein
MQSYICEHCGDPLTPPEVSENRCLNCGKTGAPIPAPATRPFIRKDLRPDLGLFGDFCLTIGQMISVIGCLVSVVVAGVQLFMAFAQVRRHGDNPSDMTWMVMIIGSIAAFLYNVAMFVVFSRVKELRSK